MSEVRNTRLLKLAELLEADAADAKGVQFNLSVWGLTPSGKVPKKLDCRTQACAVGLACLSGAFADDGLGYWISFAGGILPTFNGKEGWPAVTAFFELNMGQANYLFYAPAYPDNLHTGAAGELTVAKRIRKFVETGGECA